MDTYKCATYALKVTLYVNVLQRLQQQCVNVLQCNSNICIYVILSVTITLCKYVTESVTVTRKAEMSEQKTDVREQRSRFVSTHSSTTVQKTLSKWTAAVSVLLIVLQYLVTVR